MILKQGNCLELMKEIEDKSIDMILCDLPYGVTSCEWDTVIPFEPLWEQYNRIIKDNCAIVLFGIEPFSTHLRISNLKSYKYDWYWNKVNSGSFATAKHRPLSVIEQILVFGKNKVNYFPIMGLAKDSNKRPRNTPNSRKSDSPQKMTSEIFKVSETHDENKRYPKNLISCNNRAKELNSLKRLHSTQKPLDLLEYLIKTYTKENDLILDNCMGSGSTGVACINTNRDFIGFELDENYFKIAETRIQEAICLKQGIPFIEPKIGDTLLDESA